MLLFYLQIRADFILFFFFFLMGNTFKVIGLNIGAMNDNLLFVLLYNKETFIVVPTGFNIYRTVKVNVQKG